MRAASTQAADRFEEVSDRDVETVIRGGIPANTYLIPLMGVVAELRSLANSTTSENFIEFHAAEAAELCAARHPSRSHGRDHGRRVIHSVRRRMATAAATLAVFASATGVAMASDGAVPGDWDYGIDRALERIGIGAGGERERLLELQALEGPDDAIDGSGERSVRVAPPLGYLNDADQGDGPSVSERANEGAKPEDPGSSGGANKPEDPGSSGGANKPEDPGSSGGANKPEDPGSSGGANKPEDPGAAGSSAQPEDPGASGSADEPEDASPAGTSGQPEDPGTSGRANKLEDPGAAGSSGKAEDGGGGDNLKKAPIP